MTFFFDLDGTITDSQEGILNCVRYALESKGVFESDTEKLKPFIGPPLTNAFMQYYGFSEADAFDLLDKYRERFSKIGMFENAVYDGVEKMLADLKNDGHTLVVVTGKPEVYSRQIISHFNLDRYFSDVIGPSLSNTEEGKDELVKRAVDKFSENAVMIGDRKFDIFGAKTNGIKSVAVYYGFGTREELDASGADYFVETVEDLHKLLKSI